jgi:hypothetical protein
LQFLEPRTTGIVDRRGHYNTVSHLNSDADADANTNTNTNACAANSYPGAS